MFILAIDDNPAKANGRLEAGDEIISVNGASLVGHTHHQCLQVLRAVTATGTLTIHRRESHTPHITNMQPPPPNETVVSFLQTTAVQFFPLGQGLDCSSAPPPPSTSPPLTDEHD